MTNSIAASRLDDLERYAEPVTQVLHRAVAKSARSASADLDAALEALLSERGAARS
ncbi:hypothetical protein ABIB25_003035 [Nakamurella sp. UYEF19]|uniref:hypothetical protein n=1 Tax=Nakamurella sp. UYEF19 TaxID=1756392 RepID=UPI0033928FE3